MKTKRKPSENEVQSLIDSIKASDVVESRTQLISELGELDVSDENGRASILECLTTFWEDFTCLDVSQCMLNKTILQVASNYLESDISKCLSQLLALGTKGSIWCRKHMKMTLMSTDDSQEEEHYGLFFQLLLDMLSHLAAVLSALARHPVSTGKELMSAVETFILELLNLTKDSILEAKEAVMFLFIAEVRHWVPLGFYVALTVTSRWCWVKIIMRWEDSEYASPVGTSSQVVQYYEPSQERILFFVIERTPVHVEGSIHISYASVHGNCRSIATCDTICLQRRVETKTKTCRQVVSAGSCGNTRGGVQDHPKLIC